MEEFCLECKRKTTIISDTISGDTICTECGLVLEERIILNSFAQDEEGNKDEYDHYIRDNDSPNPFLTTNLNLHNVVMKESSSPSSFEELIFSSSLPSSSSSMLTQYEKKLTACFEKIEDLGERLLLPKVFIDRAFDVCTWICDKEMATTNYSTIAAACVQLSCEIEKIPRTKREVFAGCDNDVSYLSLCKLHAEIKMGYNSGNIIQAITPKDCIARFCSALGLNSDFIVMARRAALNSERIDTRRSPISVAAGLIYLLSGIPANHVNNEFLEKMHMATGVSTKTTFSTYKDLLVHSVFLLQQ